MLHVLCLCKCILTEIEVLEPAPGCSGKVDRGERVAFQAELDETIDRGDAVDRADSVVVCAQHTQMLQARQLSERFEPVARQVDCFEHLQVSERRQVCHFVERNRK